MSDVSLPAYWSELYQTNEAGWDKGRCAPPIERMLTEEILPRGARIAVVGCGLGHEAFAAATHGMVVTAIDFAPEAIAQVQQRSAETGLQLDAVQADVFDLARRWPSTFDAVLEHTCLCAIDPARRSEYIQAVTGALVPDGLYFGLFYAHGRPAGPPCSISEAEARQLLAPYFNIERFLIPADSFENRQGLELEFVARQRSDWLPA